MNPYPDWLRLLALLSLAAGLLSAMLILLDILGGRRQRMWIMNVVWPITGLWAGPFGLYSYLRIGRLSTQPGPHEPREQDTSGKKKPFWQATGVAATHCGSGCTLGDIVAEWLVFFIPAVLAWLGYRTLFDHKIYAVWIADYLFAFLFGILFQYFTITPMKRLSVKDGLKAALKADTLSLTAWQLGMYGWMAIATFAIFHHEIRKTSLVFWFMMQIAMVLGFLTSYPVNWLLLKSGIKERM
jgi:hypothetical protein